jgi:hypothetical protein
MNNLSVLLLNLMCMCVLIAFLITGGVMVANRPSQELPVWFHIPLCQNVEHATCPAGPVSQFSATAPPTALNVGDAAGGCCLAVTPKSTYMAAQKAVVAGGTANLPYPSLNLGSTWFDESEFVSGEPAFTDYTGSKASSSATIQPRRAFTGQCVRTDPTPTNTPRDRSAADGGAASSFSYVVPTKLMVKGFRYMPKILRTDTLELWDAEIVVSKAGPGLGPDACSSADQEAKTCRRWTFNNATAYKRRRVCAPVTNPIEPWQFRTNKVSLPDTSDNSAAAGGRRRRRNLLKGGGSSWGYAGSEPSYRTRNGRSVTYLSSSRRRTSYGYTERQHVIAADEGTTIRVDPPSYFATNTTTAASAKDTFPTASFAINEATLTTGSAMYKKQRKLFHATTVGLGDRRGYAGSKGFAEVSVAARMGSYSTDFAYSMYKKATEQVVYADLAADQFGEDDSVDSLFTYDGGTELVLTVRFRGMSNPYANVANAVQRSVAFPKVFIALVTPDDDSNYGVGCLLLVVGALGLPCLFFAFLNCVENDTLEDTCGDDETCCVEPCMTCTCCKSSSGKSSSRQGRYDSDISTYNPIKSAGADGASMKADTAFDTFMSNGIQLSDCRGNAYRDVNGDHTTVPCGRRYTSIDISTNDVSSLSTYATDTSLKYLKVHNNDINSLRGIERYRVLETLIVTNNNLRVLNTESSHQDCNLIKLDAGGNDIVRLGFGISKFPRLKLLKAPNNDIVNLEGLSSACPALECVDFRNNSLGKSATDTSIAELAPLRNLKYVHLGHNDIKSKDELITFGKTCSDSLCHINISSNDLPKSSLRQFRSILKGRGMNVRVIADDEDAMTGGAASGTAIAMAVPISRTRAMSS